MLLLFIFFSDSTNVFSNENVKYIKVDDMLMIKTNNELLQVLLDDISNSSGIIFDTNNRFLDEEITAEYNFDKTENVLKKLLRNHQTIFSYDSENRVTKVFITSKNNVQNKSQRTLRNNPIKPIQQPIHATQPLSEMPEQDSVTVFSPESPESQIIPEVQQSDKEDIDGMTIFSNESEESKQMPSTEN